MDTMRVDIAYRPLRIGWAVHSSDREALRRAVRLSHTLWGGQFNPIILVDRPEADKLIELFRVDVILPVGTSSEAAEFPKRFPHLINPFFSHELHEKGMGTDAHALAIDMHNALFHWRNTPDWRSFEEQGLRRFVWDSEDPLSDVFLMQLGAYPDQVEVGIDYMDLLAQAALVIDTRLDKAAPIPSEILTRPTLRSLNVHGLHRHYTIPAGWEYPGFFVGDASSIDDLVDCWNLRAADITLMFFDPNHAARYATINPEYERYIRAGVAHLPEHRRQLGVWAREAHLQDAIALLGGQGLVACAVSASTWHGGSVCPPMMIFGEASALGVSSQDGEKTRVSFSLPDKPFSDETWFHTQHLVASVSLPSGIYRDEQHTFNPPYVPELNEFFARTMHFEYDKVRIEPERIGIIVDAAGHGASLNALPVPALVEQLFNLAGLDSRPSGSGLMTRQLIAQLGGVDGARVFKIPGARRLVKQYGPTASFTRESALQLIGRKDQAQPLASFENHEDLYIEPRPIGTKLTPQMVFAYLVEKGLFRIGAELICPTCRLASWIALDALKQRNVCDLCGAEYDATRQLVDSVFRYRRSGVLGLERNAQGAVPVALTLQQLYINLHGARYGSIYATSYDLEAKPGNDLPTCEIDFLFIIPGIYPRKSEIILGECKDEAGQLDAKDIENLRRIADALPQRRFDVFIMFAKLAAFTPDEIALAKTLNDPYERRAILLTARELEPYRIYERTKAELGIDSYGGSARELAAVTDRIYFQRSLTDPN